jgi:hypothetical protein
MRSPRHLERSIRLLSLFCGGRGKGERLKAKVRKMTKKTEMAPAVLSGHFGFSRFFPVFRERDPW